MSSAHLLATIAYSFRSRLLATIQEDVSAVEKQHELRVLQRRLRSRTFLRRILIEINNELPINVIPDQ